MLCHGGWLAMVHTEICLEYLLLWLLWNVIVVMECYGMLWNVLECYGMLCIVMVVFDCCGMFWLLWVVQIQGSPGVLRLQSLGYGGVLCLAAVALRASFSGEDVHSHGMPWPNG